MAERKTYTDAQKAEILKRAEETSISAASKEFGVSRVAITNWKAAAGVTAGKIEAKKKTRAAGRKVKGAVTNTAEKIAGDAKDKADKVKTAEQIEAGKVKAKRARKAAEKVTAKEEKAVAKAKSKEEKSARKPNVKMKVAKLNLVFQSTMGGSITPGQIVEKLPKGAVDVYVKLEENAAYWVDRDGNTGSIKIWE